MKEQFCSYKIALKLKELGFGINDYQQLPFCYDEGGNLHLMETCMCKKYNPSPNHPEADIISDFETSLIRMGNSLEEICLAPLWQNVIDWFREMYCIFIEIEVGDYFDTYMESYLYQPICKVFKNGKIDSTVLVRDEQNNHIFYSYYKAREQAILKCIELCQKKK